MNNSKINFEIDLKRDNWFPSLESAIFDMVIKTFRTKKHAMVYALTLGSEWGGKVLKIKRRFETIWIVGEFIPKGYRITDTSNFYYDLVNAPIEIEPDFPTVQFKRFCRTKGE